MRMYERSGSSSEDVREVLALRRDLDLWVIFDSDLETQPLEDLYASGEFDGRETVNHACFITAQQKI